MLGTETTTEIAYKEMPANLVAGLTQSQLPGLDGLRALAAITVLAYHFGYRYANAGLAVLTFFVLSGFLITWLMLKEYERTATVSLRDFYVRRSLRIFPAFYFYWIVVTSGLLIASKPIRWPQALASLFYVNNYYQAFHGHLSSAYSHTWSLGVEEQFYLLWPIAFLYVQRRFSSNRVWGPALVLGVVILGFWVWRLALHLIVRVPEVWIYESFDSRCDHLLIGCLLAVLLRKGVVANLWRMVCFHPAASLMPVSMLGVSMAAANRYGTDYRNTVGFILDPLLVALLLVQVIAFARTSWWGWLNHPWMRYLGRISYAYYLWQEFVPSLVIKRLPGYSPHLQFLAAAAGVTIVASLSYCVVETPFLRLKKRYSRT